MHTNQTWAAKNLIVGRPDGKNSAIIKQFFLFQYSRGDSQRFPKCIVILY